jgi:signal transduction histidine kinase
MADPIISGFNLLGELSGDPVFAERLRIRVDGILVGKEARKEALLANAYAEAELELLRRIGDKTSKEDVRRQFSRTIAGAAETHPWFVLLFATQEQQFIALASELIRAYAGRWRLFFGPRVTATLVKSLLKDTPWNEVSVDVNKGLAYNPVRMRSISECVEIVSALLDRWYEQGRVLLGDEVSKRLFEKAFLDVEREYAFMPAAKNLIGATPRKVLLLEKAKRLHELETETATQARGLRAADQDLHQQAERLRQTVAELEETKRQLETVSQARSEFIDVVSHQFRTPLSSIRWNGELLTDAISDKEIDDKFAEPVETIRSRSVYLIETLDRVFAALDIETGKVVLDLKPSFLWEAVQDVYNQLEKDLKRRGLKWKFVRSKEQVRQIPMDKVKIAMVLKILIGNARDYNKEGGRIEVDISTEKVNGADYQVCTVRDEGIGIAKAEQERIFEKFFRAQTAIHKVADGTGLGMFIIKNYVEAHKGMIWIESAGEGKGTTVAFGLPVK